MYEQCGMVDMIPVSALQIVCLIAGLKVAEEILF